MSQPTVLLVSKAHQQSVKRLYKIIFQLHKSLPGELRQIGNSYVSKEFKLHKNASPQHTEVFIDHSECLKDNIFDSFLIIKQ